MGIKTIPDECFEKHNKDFNSKLCSSIADKITDKLIEQFGYTDTLLIAIEIENAVNEKTYRYLGMKPETLSI